jgi:hypothetical protein
MKPKLKKFPVQVVDLSRLAKLTALNQIRHASRQLTMKVMTCGGVYLT